MIRIIIYLFVVTVFYIFVFRLQEADLGFVIIVDRRNDKWSSVRCVLLHLAVSIMKEVLFLYSLLSQTFYT